VVATRWGRGAQTLCRQQEGCSPPPSAASLLRFYELQREAKFPQPPNETKSKSKLIRNRQEGEDSGRAEACAGVGMVCVRAHMHAMMCT
jgi:hypothetical protein